MTHTLKNKYTAKIGDFVAKKIPQTDWVITGVITQRWGLDTGNRYFKVTWSPDDRFPVSNRLYDTYEDIISNGIFIIRNENDIPNDFLPSN